MSDPVPPDTREAVAVFQSEEELQAAIDDLLSHGFNRAEISLLASVDTVDEKLGHRFTSVKELEDDDSVPTAAAYVPTESVGEAEGAVIGTLVYVGALAAMIPVVMSGGALAAAIAATAAGAGGGGAIGTALAMLIGQHHAQHIENQLERGGLLLWVRTWDADDERRAVEILQKHSGGDVHLHGPAAAE
jgi:hypothetical protein